MKLTFRQQRFVDEYMIDRNAAQAAIRAGYSSKAPGAVGSLVLTNYKVRAEVERRTAELSERANMTATDVVKKLAAILNANIAEYLVVDADGTTRFDLSKVTAEKAQAIQELVTESGARIRIADKVSAADKLLRHLGGYKDRIEHTGPDGGPIDVGLMTDEERLDALRELIARVKARVAGETT